VFRRPLLLLDHGPAGEQALEAAIGLCQGLGTRLHVLHAIDERGAWVALGGGAMWTQFADLTVHGERLLAAARDRLPADLPGGTQLRSSARKPKVQALEAVLEGGHDLLIAGCECRPAPGWHAFGCDAHWLVHHAPVPVLMVGDEAVVARERPEPAQPLPQ
jgi:nucleotide-binding universal stress UspA family protein